jgi:hypothetical protein
VKGIAFSPPMLRAILDGRKTVTRRVVDERKLRVRLPRVVHPDFSEFFPGVPSAQAGIHRAHMNPYGAVSVDLGTTFLGVKPDEFSWVSPFGEPGDRLWVKEALEGDVDGFAVYATDGDSVKREHALVPWPWKPSKLAAMYCPRWASRITLEITGVRVERLQAITEDDAHAEGMDRAAPIWLPGDGDPNEDREDPREVGYPPADASFARHNFQRLWDHLNAKRGAPWAANLWVYRIAFARVTP